jgi:hypothetical protein
VRPPRYFNDEDYKVGAAAFFDPYQVELDDAEEHYYDAMKELGK